MTLALGALLASVLLGTLGQLLLKAGVARLGVLSLADGPRSLGGRLLTAPAVWLGLGVYGVSMVLWLAALTRLPLADAYPFLSLSYVLITLGAWGVLHEPVDWLRLAGVVAICAGVALIARG